MSRKEDLAEKAARLKNRQAVAANPSVGAREVEPTTPRPKPPRARSVRLSLDVPPEDHAALVDWCVKIAADLQVARVPGQDVLRALLKRGFNDPVLRENVNRDVAALRDAATS